MPRVGLVPDMSDAWRARGVHIAPPQCSPFTLWSSAATPLSGRKACRAPWFTCPTATCTPASEPSGSLQSDSRSQINFLRCQHLPTSQAEQGVWGGVKKEVETSPAPPGGPKVGRRLLEGSLRNSPQKDHKMMCGPDAKEQSMTQSSCQPCKAGAITHQSINIDSRHHRGPSWASQACGGRGVLGRRDT